MVDIWIKGSNSNQPADNFVIIIKVHHQYLSIKHLHMLRKDSVLWKCPIQSGFISWRCKFTSIIQFELFENSHFTSSKDRMVISKIVAIQDATGWYASIWQQWLSEIAYSIRPDSERQNITDDAIKEQWQTLRRQKHKSD